MKFVGVSCLASAGRHCSSNPSHSASGIRFGHSILRSPWEKANFRSLNGLAGWLVRRLCELFFVSKREEDGNCLQPASKSFQWDPLTNNMKTICTVLGRPTMLCLFVSCGIVQATGYCWSNICRTIESGKNQFYWSSNGLWMDSIHSDGIAQNLLSVAGFAAFTAYTTSPAAKIGVWKQQIRSDNWKCWIGFRIMVCLEIVFWPANRREH